MLPSLRAETVSEAKMAPPRGRSKKVNRSSVDEEAAADERNRVRLASRARGTLTASSARDVGQQPCALPAALRRANGMDIVKRNAHRRRKYLLMFPGQFSVAPGARVGTLHGLDSRTPALDVEFGTEGRLRFRGALVFPKNALISVRARRGGVSIEDVFETLIVFAEWAWLGSVEANPGDVPAPLPASLRKQVATDPAFAAARLATPLSAPRTHASPAPGATATASHARKLFTSRANAEVASSDSASNSDEIIALDDDAGYAPASILAESVTPRRKLPVREGRKRMNYSDSYNLDEDKDDEDYDQADESGESASDKNGANTVKKPDSVTPSANRRRNKVVSVDPGSNDVGPISSEADSDYAPTNTVAEGSTSKRSLPARHRRTPHSLLDIDNEDDQDEDDDQADASKESASDKNDIQEIKKPVSVVPSAKSKRDNIISLDSEDDNIVALSDDDDDEYAPTTIVAEGTTPRRNSSARRGKNRINYSNMFTPSDSGEEDDEKEDDEKEDKNNTRKRKISIEGASASRRSGRVRRRVLSESDDEYKDEEVEPNAGSTSKKNAKDEVIDLDDVKSPRKRVKSSAD